MKEKKDKGSITIFLTLLLSLLLAVICSSIQSVRVSAARMQILSGMDIGLYSLFGQYDRGLLEDYELFALDGSGGASSLNLASVYDNFEGYMKGILSQNHQKLSVEQGGISGYLLLTDGAGEVFYQQTVKYMKETLGSQGLQLLLRKMEDRQQKTEEAMEAGERSENRNSLEQYDSEMQTAKNRSDEAEKARQEQEEAGSFSDSGDDSGAASGSGTVSVPKVENPIPVIKRVRKMGLLDLVVPAQKGISENSVSASFMISGRVLECGMGMPGTVEADTAYASRVLFQQYLMNKLGNFQNPAQRGLRYQIEYILEGKDEDRENLNAVVKKLLLIREGVNFAHLAADGGKRGQAQALALAIASGFLVPPASVIIEGALLLCWSFAESVLDVRELLSGGKVPLVKSSADWQLSLEKLPRFLEGLDTDRKNTENGMSYEDYLQILMLAQNKEKKVMRGMDMIEQSIRRQDGRENFCLDHCIVAMEMSVDVRMNKGRCYHVTRNYGYE